MRAFLIIAMAGLIISSAAAQRGPGRAGQQKPAEPPKPDDEGLPCFVNLTAPEYPKAALQEHIDGSVWTYATVTPQGTLGSIDTKVVSAWSNGEKLLVPPVEKAVHAATIKPECSGKKIRVVFRYDLHGEPVADPKVTTRTDGPNIMYIESQPAASAKR